MSVFRFKLFSVTSDLSAMKVNTDGVLLGAFVASGISSVPDGPLRVLDAGTGTGTIALMIAQKLAALTSGFEMIGVDSDAPSAEEAALNFASSPWADHLHSISAPFSSCIGEFWLIVSNPPFFENALPAPQQRRSSARHVSTLSYRSLLDYAATHLCPNGSVCLILPADRQSPLLRHALTLGFSPKRLTRVRTVEGKEPSRLMAEFTLSPSACLETELSIHEDGKYSMDYRALVHDYYLWA